MLPPFPLLSPGHLQINHLHASKPLSLAQLSEDPRLKDGILLKTAHATGKPKNDSSKPLPITQTQNSQSPFSGLCMNSQPRNTRHLGKTSQMKDKDQNKQTGVGM